MAATYTLSGNPKTLLGGEDFERIRAYITCDQTILADPDTGEVRILGDADLILAGGTDTAFEVELPGNGWTPSPHFYTIHVEGRSRTTGTNRIVATQPFQMTADITLADLPQAAPKSITVEDYESLIEARDEAVAAAESVTLPTDGIIAGRINDPASATATALSASYGVFVVPTDPAFGAVGDGTTDDTAALQAALDHIYALGGGALVFPRGYHFNHDGDLFIPNPGVSLIGTGGSVGGAGRWFIGDTTSAVVDFSTTVIDGVIFDNSAPYSLTDECLIVRNARGVKVRGCVFRNMGKAISVTHDNAAVGFHTVGMLRIFENFFTAVNFGIYADTVEWDVCSDWKIIGNVFNYAADTSVWVRGSQYSLTVTGTPTGGTYTLVGNGAVSATIAYNADAATLQTAIRALGGDFGTVTVTGSAGGPYSFIMPSVTTSPASLSLGTNSLTGGTTPSVGIANGGVDGVQLLNNVFFSISSTQSANPLFARKRYNAYFGKTDWFTATGNQFFEAGLSALRLDQANRLNIVNNHFAWPGQRFQGDCVEIRGGVPCGSVDNNTMQFWTRAAVGLYEAAAGAELVFGDTNRYKWTPNPAQYKGPAITMDSTNCWRIFTDTTTLGRPVIRDYQHPGSLIANPVGGVFDLLIGINRIMSRDQKSTWGGVGGSTRRAATFTVTAPIDVFSLGNFLDENVYGGLIQIVATPADASRKIASYLVHVVGGNVVTTPTAATVSAIGATTGAAANDPSFTWSVTAAHALRATSVGSTAGGFTFDIVTLGSVFGR